MRTLVTGSSGLIGTALVGHLRACGHEVVRLVRRACDSPDAYVWEPEAGVIDLEAFHGVDGVVNLAGESIAKRRWTERTKRRIVESRVKGTRLLSHTLASLAVRPRVLVSASGVGFYGHRADTALDEECTCGSGFLADVARQWEQATAPAAAAGVRVVTIRLGMVLSPNGGALPRMLLPFRLGLGGPIGGGRQYISWVAIDDVVAAIQHIVENDGVTGPVNLVSPHPVTNREFAKDLARVLGRPAFLPLPALAVRMLLGEMGTELLVASTRAVPAKLLAAGYVFRHPELPEALAHVLRGQRPE